MYEEMFDLKGKVAIVTGGNSGIGLSMAETLCKAGVKVAIVNRRAEEGQKAADDMRGQGGEAQAFQADVSKKDEVEAIVKAVEEKMGPVDILVNSAGINIRKKAVDYDISEWKQILDINLMGTFIVCQAVGKRMIDRRRGRIVNISSIASTIGLTDRAPYCASKGGVNQLTKCLSIEWAPSGVTVNAIGPGYIKTPLIAGLMKDPAFQEMVNKSTPMQRIGEPEDLNGILLVLCSKAGDYITGQTIYIDGGWTVW